MMFWVLGGVLVAICVGMMLLPLGRGRAPLDRRASASAIFKDQLAEVERDLARGVISKTEAKAAQVEVQRRLIAAQKTGPESGHTAGNGHIGLVVAALIVPVVGVLTYLQIGQPRMPSQPFAERQSEVQELREITELTDRLRERLLADASGGPSEGWMLLGQTYMRMSRYGDAADAMGRVAARAGAAPSVFTQYAEALIAAENGTVTPRAEQAIDDALGMDPDLPAAVFYKSLAVEQAGIPAAAHDMLLARLTRATEPAEWQRSFVARANELAARLDREPVSLDDYVVSTPGPSAADVEAAAQMSPEDRDAFVRSMVAGLAAKLREAPDDLDGWLRLARAYQVLGENEQALEAFQRAQALATDLPADDPRRSVIEDGLAQ